MARLYKSLQVGLSAYRDRRFDGTQEEYEDCLRQSTTVYVGNLSFFTTEEQILDLFSRVGEVRRIIIGLDKIRLTPCGFCFVVFYTRKDTEGCVNLLGGTILDERPIRVDIDWGFQEGRQFGRGKSGGQVRDEYRTDYDDGRGGYGKIVQRELEAQQSGALAGALEENHGRGEDMGSKKRGRDDDEDMPSGGGGGGGSDKRARPSHNPRFRDRNDDDEDDDDRD